MRLIVSQAAGVESQHIPGGYSLLRLQENSSEASPCSQGPAYRLQNSENHVLSQSHGSLLPPMLAPTVGRDMEQSQATTGEHLPGRGASSVPRVARLVLWLGVS